MCTSGLRRFNAKSIAAFVKLESGKTSPILLTLDAYARAVGLRLNLALLEEDDHPRGYVLMMDDPD